MFRLTSCLAVLAVLVAMGEVNATVIVLESFDYDPDDAAEANLIDNDGGFGWQGGWAAYAGTASVSPGNLTYTDGALELIAKGNHATVGNGAIVGRHFDLDTTRRPELAGHINPAGNLGVPGTLIWFSVLGKMNYTGGFSWAKFDLQRDDTSAGGNRVGVGKGSDGYQGYWNLELPQHVPSGTVLLDFDVSQPGTQSRSLHEKTFFLGRIDYGNSVDTLHLWLDPTLASEPLNYEANYVGSNSDLELDRLRLTGASGVVGAWDEIRIATTFAEVAPVPGLCTFGGDTSCNTDDLDALYAVFNTHVPPTDPLFDLNSDTVVGEADLDLWLNLAAVENGYFSPYLRGDIDLDHDVDTFDLTQMIINYTGALGSGTTWLTGDTDGDGDTDTVDLTTAIINFTSARNAAAAVPEPSGLLLLVLAVGCLAVARVRA